MTALVQHQEPHPIDASLYQTRAMQQPETAKNVHVYKNGDKYYPGRKFVVNRRHISDFDGFLTMVTNGLKAPFGAVRNIYTPNCGHRLQDLQQINNGMAIVAGGVERFRKLHYQEITGPPRRPPPPRNSYSTIKPVYHNTRMNVPARWKEFSQGPCNIYVYGNGDINGTARKMLLIPRIMKSWDMVLQEITEKISGRTCQAVRRLYTLNGELICDSGQLENGRYYVAVGNERFKRLPYGERAQHLAMLHSPRRPAALPPIRRRVRTLNSKPGESSQSYAEKYAQKKHLEEQRSHHTEPSRPEPHRRLKPMKTSTAPPPSSESDSVFHAKPVKVKRSGASGRLTQVAAADDDVFRARGDEIKAEEVDDDDDVKVDLPIDQIPADTVEDEDIHDAPIKQEEDDDVALQEREKTPSRPPTSPIGSQREGHHQVARTPSSPSPTEPRPSARSIAASEDEQPNGSAIQAVEDEHPAEVSKKMDENEAATKIQASYRGYKVRYNLGRTKADAVPINEEHADDEYVSKLEDTTNEEVDEGAGVPRNLPLLAAAEAEVNEPAEELEFQPDGPKTEQEGDEGLPLAAGDQAPGSRPDSPEKEEIGERAAEETTEAQQDRVEEVQYPSLDPEEEEHPVEDGAVDEEAASQQVEAGAAEANSVDVAEPSFDMATGQAIERPRSKTPEQPNQEQAGGEKLSLPERDAGDGTEQNEVDATSDGAKVNDSVEEPVSEKPNAEDNMEPNEYKEANGDISQESPPARPASQSPTAEEQADKILDKPTHDGPTIPNGQPAGLMEGEV